MFITLLLLVMALGYASEAQANSVLYVRDRMLVVPDDGLAVVLKRSLQFLILKEDQTAFGTITRDTPIHTMTFNDLPPSYRGIWVAQQVGEITYVLVRWEEGDEWKFESTEEGGLRDERGDFQMALSVKADALPGMYQADFKGQGGAQSDLSAAGQAQQQYHFAADGTFQQFGYAGQVSQDANATVGGTAQNVKNGTWQLYNYDLALAYADGSRRNLKLYRLADGWYFNELRFQKEPESEIEY